jgi:hypothetical protein
MNDDNYGRLDSLLNNNDSVNNSVKPTKLNIVKTIFGAAALATVGYATFRTAIPAEESSEA